MTKSAPPAIHGAVQVRRARQVRKLIPGERLMSLMPLVLIAACSNVAADGTPTIPAPPSGGPGSQPPPNPGFTPTADQATAPAGATLLAGNVLSNDGGNGAFVSSIAIETGTAGTVGAPLQGLLGQLIIGASGEWAYAIGEVGATAYAELAEGETATETFLYTPAAGSTTGTPQKLVLTVTGVNDAPVATNDAGGNVAADGQALSGNVLSNDRDVDRGAVLTVIDVKSPANAFLMTSELTVLPTVTGIYGALIMQSDGSYSYKVDLSEADTIALGVGQTGTETFTYVVSDGMLMSTGTLTFTISGINDAPTAADDAAALTEDASVNIATGNVIAKATDRDSGTALQVASVEGIAAGQPVRGVFGTLTVQAGGTWEYVLDNADPDTQALESGASAVDEFSFTITDGQGGTSSAKIRITISGAADGPPPIVGTSGADVLTGTAEGDVLNGLAGDDILAGLAGADIIDGGEGADTASYAASDAAVVVNLALGTGSGGHAAGDQLISIERVIGSQHGDTLIGNAVANILDGGDGDDTLVGGAGADVLNGGNGNDTASYAQAAAGLTIDLRGVAGTGDAAGDTFISIERIVGSAFDDLFLSGAGAETFDGGGGTDTVSYANSSAGVNVNFATTASGGDAEGDTFINIRNLIGSSHADVLAGDALENSIDAGGGDDLIYSSNGADLINGNAGSDTLSYHASDAGISINLLLGTASGGHAEGDVLTLIENLVGSSLADSLTGDAGNNRLEGRGGDDTINGGDGDDFILGGMGADTLSGGSGFDTVSYEDSAAAVTVDLASGTGSGGDAAGDVLSSDIEKVIGSGHADHLTAAATGSTLDGGDGNDTLVGGAGSDRFIGGAGADTITGNGGFDFLFYDNSTAAVTVSLTTGTGSGGHAEGDIISGVEGLVGSSHNDHLTGDSGANLLQGGLGDDQLFGLDGNDRLIGDGGADTLDGGNGTDTASYEQSLSGVTASLVTGGSAGDAAGDTYVSIENLFGSAHNDELLGDDMNNILSGGDGDDVLSGLGGDDTIFGGAGADTIDGGLGNDVISYISTTDLGDLILGFEAGNDVLNFSVSSFGTPGDGSWTFVSGTDPLATTTQATFLWDTDSKQLFWDGDGTGGAQTAMLVATFTGLTTDLVAGDIIVA